MMNLPHLRLDFFILAFAALLGFFISASAQTNDERAQFVNEIKTFREDIAAREKLLLAPSQSDREQFADFLQQPDTGIIRLLPREKYDGVLRTRGGGAFYSFARLTHEYGYGSDIEFERGNLSVGFAGADYGFFVALGDVPLESVKVDSAGVKFLAEYVAPQLYNEASAEFYKFGRGVQIGEWKYSRRLPAVVGQTYALRSINYDRSDILVVFRVVRKDATDDSLIIVWKELKRFPKPELKRAE